MERKAKGILALGLAAVLLLIPGGVLIENCLSTPGIRFYEREVAKPAEKVKVSVVVPVYNAEKYLEPCLDSLRKQTLKEIEIFELDYNKYLLADKELWRQWWRQSFPELGIDEKLQQKTADALITEGR